MLKEIVAMINAIQRTNGDVDQANQSNVLLMIGAHTIADSSLNSGSGLHFVHSSLSLY